MNTIVTSKIMDIIVDFGVRVAQNHFNAKFEVEELRCTLKEYIERQSKYNEICSHAEEFDFEGLVEYVTENLCDQVDDRIFAVDPDDRDRARKSIIASAVEYSHASSKEAIGRITKCINDLLNIIRSFYAQRIPREIRMLAGEIVENSSSQTSKSVIDAMQGCSADIIDNLDKRFEEMKDLVSASLGGPELSIVRSATTGNFIKSKAEMRSMLDTISQAHPLYPDYGYTWQDDNYKSIARNDEAKKRYPPQLHLTGKLHVGDKYYNTLSQEVIDYSYRHQLNVVIDVSDAMKFLGVTPDPMQCEAEALIGGRLISKPRPFPDAFPCSINVDGEPFFRYVLFRTQEILDDGTIIVGNREQKDSSFYFELQIQFKEFSGCKVNGKAHFKYSLLKKDNKERLKCACFLEKLGSGGKLQIIDLQGEALLMDSFLVSASDKDYKAEIELLKKLCAVEDYFNVSFDVDDGYDRDDVKIIYYLYDLINKESVEGTWETSSMTIILNQSFRERLEKSNGVMEALSYIGSCTISIFKVDIKYKLMRCFHSVQIKDYDKTLQLANLLEDGKSIEVHFIPKDNNEFYDTLHIPDNMTSTS